MVHCTDGTQLEVHPAYQFTDAEWGILPQAERDRVISERASYKRRRTNNDQDSRSLISEITTDRQQGDLCSLADTVNVLQQTVAGLTTQQSETENNDEPPTSIMGGRNEQARLRGSHNRT